MRSQISALFCLVCVAGAQSLSAPRVGFMLDRSHYVRPVFGMAGNFILGEAVAGYGEILSFAFSGKSGLAKTESQLLLLDGGAAITQAFDAPPGEALFAFHADGTPAYCYFEATGELDRIGPDGLVPLEKFALPDGALTSREVRTIHQMGDGWMQIDTADGIYARRTATGAEYRLPEPAK